MACLVKTSLWQVLNEKELFIGDTYTVGNAIVQITQPREPCYKFGVKFGTQEVLKQFIDHGFPGTYVRVLEEGTVKIGDTFQLLDKANDSISIFQFFELLFAKHKNQDHIKTIMDNQALPQRKRDKLKLYL